MIWDSIINSWLYLYIYWTQVSLVRSLCPDVRPSVTNWRLWNLTDVTLADEDTNSILTDNANRAIQGNVAMQWCNLVANFGSNANGASWWPNFEPMQVVPLGDPICNWCEWLWNWDRQKRSLQARFLNPYLSKLQKRSTSSQISLTPWWEKYSRRAWRSMT